MPDRNARSLKFPVAGVSGSARDVRVWRDFFAGASGAGAYLVMTTDETDGDLLDCGELEALPIERLEETEVLLQPGRIYLIPPGRGIKLVDSRIIPRDGQDRAPHPIDRFFREIAEAYREDACAVILSGTGADGMLGSERIKELGGFVLVQDPKDAEFPEMPAGALADGHADVVLPAGELSRKIAAIFHRNGGRPLADENPANPKESRDAASLREILTLVRVRTGHDFDSYKRPTILRRVDRRLQVHELDDMAAYARLLRKHPDEVQRLLKDLLITVTHYFRDPEPFAYLEQHIIPRLFEGRGATDCVRVWSCGCSSGEEPYSLGMLLMEYAGQLPDPPRIQIFASDINQDAVKVGRDGFYKASIAADVPPARLKRFFVELGGGMLQVNKDLRGTVLFAPHNVLHDPPFSHIDLVVCRNLLIYLNRETQKRMMELFSFALDPDGFLFLGSSESAEGGGQLFTTVDKKNRIYQNSSPVKRPQVLPGQMAVRWETKRPLSSAGLPVGTLLEHHHYRLLCRYAPASVLITSSHEIVHMNGNVGEFMQMPPGLPTRDLVESVHPSLQLDLRAVLTTAIHENREAKVKGVRLTQRHPERRLTLVVRPANIPGKDYFLVAFEESSGAAGLTPDLPLPDSISRDSAMKAVVRRLEEDLQETRERLHLTLEQGEITAEELKASNEELQAINEELRSATEELETSREELQSVNEELATVNLELKEKVEEISSSHSDLQNLMHSSDIGTVFLTRDFKIKRYTRRVEQLINIIESDIGRPFDHLTCKFEYANLATDAVTVLTTLKTIERQLFVPSTGHVYLARLCPCRTLEDRIEGVVISFVDVTEMRRSMGMMDPDGR